jgi:nucleoside-diphosphate-sugar epimerase
MRVLVTGATGFVASRLVPRLAQEHEVIALGHDADRIAGADGVERLEVDLRDRDFAQRLPEVEAVVHLAQANVPFPDGAADLFAVNTASTAILLEHARRVQAQAFVFASSASVYGLGDMPWREDDTLSARDFYSATKVSAERLVLAYEQQFSGTIMRLVAPYGPGQSGRMIPRLIDSVREGRTITLNPGAGPRMNPVYIDDLVDLIRVALHASESNVVNVAGDDAVTIRELSDLIGSIVGREPVYEEREGARGGDIVCENGTMKNLLGGSPLVPLREGLARTIASERVAH